MRGLWLDYIIRIIIFTVVVIVKNFDRNTLESSRKPKKFKECMAW